MLERIHAPLAACIATIIGFAGVAHSAEIKVLSDGPLEPGLVKIAESFRRDSGHEVKFVFGLSPVIQKKITDGETGDAVIIQPDYVDELVKAGKVAAGQNPIIGRVGIGLIVRADAPARDVSTSEALKQALLGADSLFFNNVASGNYFAKILERLGIADALKERTTRTSPADVVARVLQGKGNDIGVGTVTQIIADKRLKLGGALPSELQSYIVYTAAVMMNAQQPEAARAFIGYLASPSSKDTFAASGVD